MAINNNIIIIIISMSEKNTDSVKFSNVSTKTIKANNVKANNIQADDHTILSSLDVKGQALIRRHITNGSKSNIGFNLGIAAEEATKIEGVLNTGIVSLAQGYQLSFVSTRGTKLSDGNQKNFMGFYPDSLAGRNYNPIVRANDHAIISGLYGGADGTTVETKGGIVICPWSGTAGGLRMDNTGNIEITGNLNVTGAITAEGTITASYTESDYRIKENVETLDESHNVDNLRPVVYDNIKNNKKEIGFIAHELQEEYPFLVDGEKDGEKTQSVNYIGIIGVLVNEIQSLKMRMKELEQKN
jgi:hypothetical protein